MQVRAHLVFDGQCEAAFRTYEQLLGGELVTLLKYADTPMAGSVDARARDRIVHATLRVGDQELLGADVPPGGNFESPRGIFVLLSLGDLAEARRVFDALSEGGTVVMPLEKTFWSPGFGVVTDRFGTPWEITV
jgi:PhnB protein